MKLPKFLLLWLECLHKGSDRESLPGDYAEIFDRIEQSSGSFRARSWLIRQLIMLTFVSQTQNFWKSFSMLKNYIKTGVRTILRHKTYSIINITGLALGMAAFIMIFFFIRHELSYDRFHTHGEQIYRVITEQVQTGSITITAETQYPLAEALKNDIPEIVDSCRILTKMQNIRLQYNDKTLIRDQVFFADASFMQMFSFPLKQGNPDTALSDPYSIVLTSELSKNLFGQDSPLGKIIQIDYSGRRQDLQVTGVLEQFSHPSHLKFDALIPFNIFSPLYADVANLWETADNYQTYIRLHPQASFAAAAQKTSGIKSRYIPGSYDRLHLQAMTSIHLHSQIKFDPASNKNIRTIYFFSLIAAFIILIACINFMNLSTARSGTRSKEIAVRRVIGARRSQLIRQFLGESLTIALAAGFCALVLIGLTHSLYTRLSGSESPFSVENLSILAGLLLGLILFTGFIAGAYPALILSSAPPTLGRQSIPLGLERKKGAVFRKILVVVQFSISIILIAGTLIVSRQLSYLQNFDLGFKKENIIYVPLRGTLAHSFPDIKQDIAAIPGVDGVTAANILPTRGNESLLDSWDGNSGEEKIVVNITSVDHDYIQVMNMDIAAGRAFSREYTTDLSQAVIINQEASRQMGLESPLGKRVWGKRIIGVVQDYNFLTLKKKVAPIILSLTDRHYYNMLIRIGPGDKHFLQQAAAVIKRYSPDYLFEYHYLEDDLAAMYYNEEQISRLFRIFAALAVFIACLGMTGLASFTAERRTKEIGIRKVLGASTVSIVSILTRNFTGLVVLANVFALPAAYLAMDRWLQNYVYRTGLDLKVFAFSGILVLVAAGATVGVLALRAASADPVMSLRDE